MTLAGVVQELHTLPAQGELIVEPARGKAGWAQVLLRLAQDSRHVFCKKGSLVEKLFGRKGVALGYDARE